MLPGFEKETVELNDYEKFTLVRILINGLKKKHGKANAVTNKQIVESLKDHFKISDTRVRKIISYIRANNLLPGLVANSDGYYITKDPHELSRYIKSLQGRENEIRKIREGMVKYLKQITPDYQGNFRFPEMNQ